MCICICKCAYVYISCRYSHPVEFSTSLKRSVIGNPNPTFFGMGCQGLSLALQGPSYFRRESTVSPAFQVFNQHGVVTSTTHDQQPWGSPILLGLQPQVLKRCGINQHIDGTSRESLAYHLQISWISQICLNFYGRSLCSLANFFPEIIPMIPTITRFIRTKTDKKHGHGFTTEIPHQFSRPSQKPNAAASK